MRNLPGCLIAALSLSELAHAQDVSPTIKSAIVTNPRQVMVVFSLPLTAAPAPQFEKARVRLLPDNVMPTSIIQNLVSRDAFTVGFTAVPAGATRICFDEVRFQTATETRESSDQLCANLSRDPAAAKEAWLTAFRNTPKTSRDKDIFASGFVTAAAKKSTGGVDLSLNPEFRIPNLNAFLQIKKATADEGDARSFESGTRYRYTGTWRPEELRRIAATTDDAALNELIRARQRNIIAGWLLDIAGKLEGDPTKFDVTNFVGEAAFQLRTMTKGFLGRKGFWRGFVLPAGVELGQSLGTTVASGNTPAAAAGTTALEVSGIARYKAGAGVTVYYDNAGAQSPVRRLEVDVNGVLRHLVRPESRFNPQTRKIDTTDEGLQGYAQIDLKVFFAETDAGRYGFKLSYNRGRLPPVYAEVKSLDFGFVIESGDQGGTKTAERDASASGRPARN